MSALRSLACTWHDGVEGENRSILLHCGSLCALLSLLR
jgi:hypothetical protein